jgi:TetR/AcrR family transcriptional regulator of autoinduction and epiphytic fitness
MRDPSTDVGVGAPPEELGRDGRPRPPFGGPSALASKADAPKLVPVGASGSLDGRTQRRERNREAVIEALLDIIRGGDIEPSASAIADRAGVSHRSVFRYFADLDDLVRTAVDHEFKRAYPLGVIPEIGQGSLERRVDALIDSRLRVYSATFQVSEMARMRSSTIPAIDEGLRIISDVQRTQFRRNFALELERRAGDPTVEFMVDAAMVLTCFESYSHHRRIFGHSMERVRRVWSTALLALLEAN